MLKYRLISGVLIIGTLVALTLWGTDDMIHGLLVFIAGLAAFELTGMYEKGGYRPHRLGVTGLCAALVALTAWCPDESGTGYLALLSLGTVAVLFGQLTRKDDDQPMASIGASLHVLLYIGVLFSFFPRLIHLGEPEGRYLGVLLIVLVKITDTGAYFTGRAIGKHKFIPRLSPGKTWEGCVGGLVFSLAAATGIWVGTDGMIAGVRFGLVDALVMAVLMATIGTAGDLMESQVKRAVAIKDSGAYIKGMGGIMDVVDSLLPTLPVLYFYLRYLIERGP